MKSKRVDQYRYISSDCYQLVPVLGHEHGSKESEIKLIINQLCSMNEPFLEKGAGQVRKNETTQEQEYFDVPHVSYKLYKEKGKIFQYISIPKDESLVQTIQQTLSLDVGECKFVESKIRLAPEHLYAFAVKGDHHLSINLQGQYGHRFQSLFDMIDDNEQLLYSLTVKEVKDHQAKRNKLIKRLSGLDPSDWKSVLWYYIKHYSRKGISLLGDFLFEEEMKKIQLLLNKLKRKKLIRKTSLFSKRKTQSEANRYMDTEVLFLFWTKQEERVQLFQKALQKLLTDMQGDNQLEVVRITPDLTKIEKGYIHYQHPLLCLYQKELSQFLYLPSVHEIDESFYVERKQKTEIPSEMFRGEPGAIALAKDLHNGEVVSLPAPKSKQDLDDRVKAMLLVGEQGSGKTSLLENQIVETFYVKAQSREEWKQHARSVVAFDVADAQMIVNVLKHIPEWLQDRVIILNHSDSEHPIPVGFHDILKLNPKSRSIPKQIAMMETQILLDSLKDNSKTVSVERYLKNALQASYTVGKGNLLDAMRILLDSNYRREIKEKVVKKDVYLHIELSQFEKDLEDNKTVLKTIENRISSFRTDPDLMAAIAQEPMEEIDFWKWMNGDEDGAYLVLIYLPGSGQEISQVVRRFLFTHYFIKIWNLMLARERLEPAKRTETLVIIDELHQVLDQRAVQNLFGNIFKEPRKYRVRFIFTFHGWSSMDKAGKKKDEIIKSMKEAGSNLVLLKGGSDFFKSLSDLLVPYTVDDLRELMRLEYCGIFRVAVGKKAHVFQSRLLEPTSERLPVYRHMTMAEFRTLNNKYGRPREEVEQQIHKELSQIYKVKSYQVEEKEPYQHKSLEEELKEFELTFAGNASTRRNLH